MSMHLKSKTLCPNCTLPKHSNLRTINQKSLPIDLHTKDGTRVSYTILMAIYRTRSVYILCGHYAGDALI